MKYSIIKLIFLRNISTQGLKQIPFQIYQTRLIIIILTYD